MTNINDVYLNLTGINIDTQKLLWDERGKGYYGEYLVFKELYPTLTGNCKILMNLQIPTDNGRTTEIDLLLIHETGLYVFEVKHYKGTIYGKTSDQKWTQYFRTSPNSHFYNPIRQNQYHIKALQKNYSSIPIHSLIVFTSPHCDLRVDCTESNIEVLELRDLYRSLQRLNAPSKILDIDRIDSIFNELLPFSPIATKTIVIDEDPIPFHQYINNIIKEFQERKELIRSSFLAAQKRERKKTRTAIITAAVAVVACVALSIFSCLLYRSFSNAQIAAAEQALADFSHKFEQVAAFNNGDLDFSKDLLLVKNVVVEPSSDIDNTTNVSFMLMHNGTDYGTFFNEDSAITVILKDGTVKECKVFNEKYPYVSDIKFGRYQNKEKTVPAHEFYNTSIEDIAYIKLTNIGVWTYVNSSQKILSKSYEIELYTATK